MIRNLATIVSFILLIGAGLALTLVSPVPLPRTIEVVPSTTSKLVCATMQESGTLLVDGADTIWRLGEDGDAATGPTRVSDVDQPRVVRGGSSLTAGTMTVRDSARAWLPCTAPTSRGTLLVPGAADTDLVITNPDSSEAVVDLSLYGADGEIVALGARGIAVGPYSSRTVALSVLVERAGPVGVSFHASRGRATVTARTTTADGVLAAATAFAPSTSQRIAGVAMGATTASLLLSNPGNERAEVDVVADGATMAYQPEGGAAISVPPYSTVAVDLAPSLSGEPTGLRVTSDVDVAVGLSTGTGTDLAFTSPVPSSAQLGAYAPAGGVLQLSNPGDTLVAVTVSVDVVDGESTTTSHPVPAGTTINLPLAGVADHGQIVAITAAGPLYGAVTETGAGVSVVPLGAIGVIAPEPIDAEIVPTLR